jgi:CRP-like cAMP-binding protein
MPAALERVLRDLPFFAPLRPDELVRVAARFRCVSLQPGESLTLYPSSPELVTVLSGRAVATTSTLRGQPVETVDLARGDSLGDVALASGQGYAATITALGPAEIASIGEAGLREILAEFPIVALPLVENVAEELRFKDSLIRELGEIEALGLSGRELEGALSVRRRALRHHGTHVLRRAADAVYREVVVARGREPAFWMLLGFTASLLLARLVVGGILRYHLEKQMFALVHAPGEANPMHLHHFNYGLVLVAMAGLGSFLPATRRWARLWPALFGIGAGLIFDEWALIWNLDPNYYQGLSYVAAAIFFAFLMQVVLFRRFWTSWARRFAVRFST